MLLLLLLLLLDLLLAGGGRILERWCPLRSFGEGAGAEGSAGAFEALLAEVRDGLVDLSLSVQSSIFTRNQIALLYVYHFGPSFFDKTSDCD